MLGPKLTGYANHSQGGQTQIEFTASEGDGIPTGALPTNSEIAAALDTLYQSMGFNPLVFYGTDTEQVQVYPPAEGEG